VDTIVSLDNFKREDYRKPFLVKLAEKSLIKIYYNTKTGRNVFVKDYGGYTKE